MFEKNGQNFWSGMYIDNFPHDASLIRSKTTIDKPS